MSGLLAVAVIVSAVLFILGTVALVGFIVKVLLWALLFPLRLAFKLVFGLVGLTLGGLLIPIVLLVAGIGLIGALVVGLIALITPLLPVILLGLVGWAIYRISNREQTGFVGS
jgi:hypothetical protein